MSQGQVFGLFLAIGLVALLLYRKAKREEAVAHEHQNRVNNANAMVGIAGTIIQAVLG
jgi:hypothetical protein